MKKAVFFPAAILPVLFVISGCSLFNIGKEPDIVRIERKLRETNKKIEKIHEDVQTILTMVTKHETRISKIEYAVGPDKIRKTVAKKKTKKKTDPVLYHKRKPDPRAEDLYSRAISNFNRRELAKASTLFNSFLDSYPDHYRSNYAQSWLKHIEKLDQKHGETRRTQPPPKQARPYSAARTKKSPSNAERLYNRALEAFDKKRFESAETLFDSFVRGNPGHYLADNALYWLGECKYSKNRFYDAVLTFKEIVDKYPKGNKVPDALLKIGFAYLALDDPENAAVYLQKAADEHPLTPAGIKAGEKLKTIKTRKQRQNPQADQDALQVYLRSP